MNSFSGELRPIHIALVTKFASSAAISPPQEVELSMYPKVTSEVNTIPLTARNMSEIPAPLKLKTKFKL